METAKTIEPATESSETEETAIKKVTEEAKSSIPYESKYSVSSTSDTVPTNGTLDTDSTEASALEKKIAKQIEYYFGDMNLTRDKFLLDMISQDYGWVPLEVMIKFNRLNALTKDYTTIVSALKKSPTGMMQVSEDGLKIRRDPENKLPENTKERRDEVNRRTVYAKGFPKEMTLDELQDYFSSHGTIENIYKRTYGTKDEKIFKGSVFATFKDKQDADKFVKSESIKFKDQELVRFYRTAYFDQKNPKKKTQDDKEKVEKEEPKEDEDEMVKSKMTTGALLMLNNLSDDTKIADIKTLFHDISPVSWVDHYTQKNQACVRFTTGTAQSSLDSAKEANEGKLEICGKEVAASVADGQEEFDHWKGLFRELNKLQKTKKGRGGGRAKKGGGPGVKRKHGKDGGPSKYKKFKEESESDEDMDEKKEEKKKEIEHEKPEPVAAVL